MTGLIAQGGGPAVVRAAIVRALQERHYNVEVESGQEIVANYARGRHYLQIAISYESTSFHIVPMQVEGLHARHYERYVTDLERTIQEELARSEREARARAVAASRPGVVVVDGGGGAVVGGAVVGGAVVGGSVVAGGAVVGGAVVGGGVVAGGPVLMAPGYATCESVVVAYGHSSIHTNHCRPETDVACADALLSMGHSPTSLLFCSNVEPNCARQWLLSGGTPVGLNRCRY